MKLPKAKGTRGGTRKAGPPGTGNGGTIPPVATRWKKGQSGNPSGISKTQAEWKSRVRELGTKALETLGRRRSERVLIWICEQGYGKPVQPTEHTGDLNVDLEVQGTERFDEALKRIIDLTRRREEKDEEDLEGQS